MKWPHRKRRKFRKDEVKRIKAKDENEIKRLQAMMIDRISLGVNAHDANLTINDRNGKKRIVIRVDANNNPEIKIFDENGKEIECIPKK